MNLDTTTLCHIYSFVLPQRTHARSLSIFGVCREWRTTLCGPASVPFWQRLFHARFPRFLQPVSPSKKRSVSVVSHDYRKLYLYTSAILQVDATLFNPAKSAEFEDPLVELPQDSTRYRSELMESIALRLFSKKFTQFVMYNRHHLLYGPAGCGKATLIESLARMWGSHLITIQYPELLRIASLIDWTGYVDIMCNYVLSFCELNYPIIVHLRHMSHSGTPTTQTSLNSLLKNIPIANVWVIGTTNSPNTAVVQHSEHLTAKLYIPFPSVTERETYLRAHLLPSSSAPAPTPRISTLNLPSPLPSPRLNTFRFHTALPPYASSLPSPSDPSSLPSPSPSDSSSLLTSPCDPCDPSSLLSSPSPLLSSSPSSSLFCSPLLPSGKACAVSAPYVHLLALRTPLFTYTDLRALCQMLKDEFIHHGDQKTSLPFIKLMDVLGKVVPFYKPEDAKRYESTDPAMGSPYPVERRRQSVPAVI